MNLDEILSEASERARALTHEELVFLLSLTDKKDVRKLFDAAYVLKVKYAGHKVAIRGIIEAGNICQKNCYYCGIRKGNANLERYSLKEDDILRLAEENVRLGYKSLVIQSGEIESDAHSDFIESVLTKLKPLELGITLSLGEQSEEVFKRWHDAGASRYLLRIETTNRELYRRLHPADHSFERRVEALSALRRCGYQVGTGVMILLPGQTVSDLANDIRFFAETDADMIGMGPYIPHEDTPIAKDFPQSISKEERLLSGLKMIAVTRLYLHDVNIAAATALQALKDDGREQGIKAGANVIMPNITDTMYRRKYQLYAGKPSLDENANDFRQGLEDRLAAIGEKINYDSRGDSIHWQNRQKS